MSERARARLPAPSVPLSHRQAIAFLCLDYCVQQSSPLYLSSPSTPAVEPLWWRVWRKMGAMWWNGATVKYGGEGRQGSSSFLTFSLRPSDGEFS